MKSNKRLTKIIKFFYYSIYLIYTFYIKYTYLSLFYRKVIYCNCLMRAYVAFTLNNKNYDIKFDNSKFYFNSNINKIKKITYKNYLIYISNNFYTDKFYYQKINLLNLFDFNIIRNQLQFKDKFNKILYLSLNKYNTLLNLFSLNNCNKSELINLLQLNKLINKKKNIYFLKNLKNNNLVRSKQNTSFKFFVSSKKLTKIKSNRKIYRKVAFSCYFKYIRRFRSFIYLFIIYLFLFWFNKLILIINMQNNSIKFEYLNFFFINIKSKINLNIRYLWLEYKVYIPLYNLNYILFNNIIKSC